MTCLVFLVGHCNSPRWSPGSLSLLHGKTRDRHPPTYAHYLQDATQGPWHVFYRPSSFSPCCHLSPYPHHWPHPCWAPGPLSCFAPITPHSLTSLGLPQALSSSQDTLSSLHWQATTLSWGFQGFNTTAAVWPALENHTDRDCIPNTSAPLLGLGNGYKESRDATERKEKKVKKPWQGSSRWCCVRGGSLRIILADAHALPAFPMRLPCKTVTQPRILALAADRHGSKSKLCQLLDKWPWANYSSSLSFPIDHLG